MSSLKKILIGLGSVGAITGLAVGSYYLSKLKSPKNIRDKLLKEGLTPLDTSAVSTQDDEKWKILIKKHSNSANSSKRISTLTFSYGADKNPIDADVAGIKSQCSRLFGTKITKDEDFAADLQNARDWCTNESEFLKK